MFLLFRASGVPLELRSLSSPYRDEAALRPSCTFTLGMVPVLLQKGKTLLTFNQDFGMWTWWVRLKPHSLFYRINRHFGPTTFEFIDGKLK